MSALSTIGGWCLIAAVVFLFWRAHRGRVWRKVSAPLDVTIEGPLAGKGSKWRPLEEGGALVWRDRASWSVTLWSFVIGCFFLGILVLLAVNSGLSAPRSYLWIDAIFPPWHHPFHPASYLKLFFNLVPLACFALTIWSIGGEVSYVASRDLLKRQIRWFGMGTSKAIRDGRIELKLKSEDAEHWMASLWSWDVEVRGNGGSMYLVGDSQSSGPHLSVTEPEGIVARLAQATGWEIERLVCHEQRPPPSAD